MASEFSGTEKQVEWAKSIRAQWLRNTADIIEEAREYEGEAYFDTTIALIERVSAQEAASWWIDRKNRVSQFQTMINEVATDEERAILAAGV
jgi:hypothetical protein